jgi:hypothetical protein
VSKEEMAEYERFKLGGWKAWLDELDEPAEWEVLERIRKSVRVRGFWDFVDLDEVEVCAVCLLLSLVFWLGLGPVSGIFVMGFSSNRVFLDAEGVE